MGQPNSLVADLLTTDQAAELLDLHPVTLAQYRVDQKGPTYIKKGHRVYYRREHLEAWLQVIEPA